MKIVIDIPEEDYILAKKEDFSAVYDGNHVAKAIKHGIPLEDWQEKSIENPCTDCQEFDCYGCAYKEREDNSNEN